MIRESFLQRIILCCKLKQIFDFLLIQIKILGKKKKRQVILACVHSNACLCIELGRCALQQGMLFQNKSLTRLQETSIDF